MYKYEKAIGAAGGLVAVVWLIALAMGQATTSSSGAGDYGAGGPMFLPGFGAQGYIDPGFGGPGVGAPGAAGRAGGPGPGAVYPIPYAPPTRASIDDALHRILAFANTAMPARALDRGTNTPITDFTKAAPGATMDRGEGNGFQPLDYTLGVTHSGMLACAAVTGDKRFSDFVARHMQFLHDAAPYFKASAAASPGGRNPFSMLLTPDSLDASGSMCAALIKARQANIGPDLMDVIDRWADYVHTKQFRLADGTLARHRPQDQSIWADDLYMSVPALAGMGKLTGKNEYFDDAIKQVRQFAKYLFVPAKGIYMHGINLDQPDNPEFYWGRANGWAMMADCELLDALPEDYPGREDVLKILRAHIKGIAQLQSGEGLWHQLLDRPDSYLETSASAIFVYCMAHAIDKGWISPVSYGDVAQVGWNAVAMRINAKGQVEGTCVGTTFAGDAVYYYARPTSVDASHGYGPVLLAGAEMIRMLQMYPAAARDGTYLYLPKSAATQPSAPGR
jgi:rhamnogalacturonyl hydrolase YesR